MSAEDCALCTSCQIDASAHHDSIACPAGNTLWSREHIVATRAVCKVCVRSATCCQSAKGTQSFPWRLTSSVQSFLASAGGGDDGAKGFHLQLTVQKAGGGGEIEHSACRRQAAVLINEERTDVVRLLVADQ